jgi:hypothetical protein
MDAKRSSRDGRNLHCLVWICHVLCGQQGRDSVVGLFSSKVLSDRLSCLSCIGGHFYL